MENTLLSWLPQRKPKEGKSGYCHTSGDSPVPIGSINCDCNVDGFASDSVICKGLATDDFEWIAK